MSRRLGILPVDRNPRFWLVERRESSSRPLQAGNLAHTARKLEALRHEDRESCYSWCMRQRRSSSQSDSSSARSATSRSSREAAAATATDSIDGPVWGVACLAAVLVARPLLPTESAPQGTGVLLIFATLGLVFAWAITSWRGRSRPLSLGGVDVLLGGFLAWQTASALRMASTANARPLINMVWESLACGAVWFLVRQWVRSPKMARTFVVLLAAMGAGLSMHGFFQCVYVQPRDRAAWQADPQAVLQAAGVVAPPGSALFSQFENRLMNSREPLGTFALTNSLAGYLLPSLVFLGVLLLVAGGVKSDPERAGANSTSATDKRTWFGMGLAMLVIAACLILTKSRSAYVGLAAGVGMVAMWAVRSRWRIDLRLPLGAAAVLGGLVLLAAKFGYLDLQVLSEAKKSLGYRLEYWQATVAMIRDYPLSGCGVGNFQAYYAKYKLPQSSEMVADPHNFLFEIAATSGLPALALWVFAWIVWLRQMTAGGATADSASASTARAAGLGSADRGDLGASASQCRTVVLAGAIGGLLFGFVAAFMSHYAVELVLLVTAAPIAAAVIYLLGDWIESGRLPASALMIGVAALMVNFLAAGGISFPAVSLQLWIFGALALNLAEPPNLAGPAPRAATAVATLSLVGLLGLFALTMYRPVFAALTCEPAAAELLARGDVEGAKQQLANWADADPWSPEPWQRRAVIELQLFIARATATKSSISDSAPFREAAINMLQRDGNSFAARRQLAQWSWEAFRQTNDRSFLEEAILSLHAANRLYPNSSLGHAQLAKLYLMTHQYDLARAEGNLALRLDAANPHSEQKLDKQRLDEFPAPNGKSSPGRDLRTAEEWAKAAAESEK